MKTTQWKMNSKIGPLYLVASEKGLRGVFWKKQSAPVVEAPSGIHAQAMRELEEYLDGSRKNFEVALDPQGTPFQIRVWTQLRKIPYGTTLSYRELARKIGNEKAFRAVGSANARNPLCIIIPCHRVIAADGSLGGYSGGLAIKSNLIEMERKSSN